MKNYFKTLQKLILVSVLLIFFGSCEDEQLEYQTSVDQTEEILDNHNHLEHLGITYNVIDIEEDSDLKAYVASKTASNGKSLTGNRITTAYGDILLEEIIQVTDSLGNKSSTFDIEPKSFKFNEFSNFVVNYDANGETTAKIITYRPDYDFVIKLSRGEETMHNFRGKKFEYDADEYISAIPSKTNCFDVPTPCLVVDNSDPNSGNNSDTTDDGDISEPETSNGNTSGSGSGGGNGSYFFEPTIESAPTSGGGGGCTVTTISVACGSGQHTGQPSCTLDFKGYSIQIRVCTDNKTATKAPGDIGEDCDTGLLNLNAFSFKYMPTALNFNSTSLDWLNADCERAKLAYGYIEAFQFSSEAKRGLEKAVAALSGQLSINDLDTREANNAYTWLIGYLIANNHEDLKDMGAILLSLVGNQNLSFQDAKIIARKAKNLLGLSIDYENNTRAFDVELSSIVYAPHIKALGTDFFPQTEEEWKALAEILSPLLVEIGLAVIPGSDIIGVVQGLEAEDYWMVAGALAGLTLDAFGGTVVKVVAKFSKAVYKGFKIVRVVGDFLLEVGEVARRGFKVVYENGEALIKNATGRILARGDDVGRVAANIADAINDAQRAVINQWSDNIASATNKQKGNFGEIGADLDLSSKGYLPLQPRISDINANGHNGLDGVYRKGNEYFIVEGKYTGSASLNPANLSTGLDRQMSDAWIRADNRLVNAVGEEVAQDILAAGYNRILAKVAPDGSVTYQYVSNTGYLSQGSGPLGTFNP